MLPSPFDRTPTLRPDLVAVALPPARVVVLGDGEQHLLDGPGYAPLFAAMDGRRTLRAIVAHLAAHGRPDGATALYLTDRLRAAGLVVDRPEDQERTAPAPDAMIAALATHGVVAHAIDAIVDAPGAISYAIGTHAADAIDAIAPVALPPTDAITLVDDLLDPRLGALDAAARAASRRCLPLRAAGQRWRIGPTLGAAADPAAGPCWHCLADRLRLHRPVQRWLAEQGITPPPLPRRPGEPAALAALAPALTRWLDGDDPFASALVEFDPATSALEPHPVARRPQCPACGDLALIAARAERPIVLRPRPIAFDADGGHRVVSPDATWERLAHHVDPVTGVIARLGPLPGRDHPERPVFAAVSPLCPRRADAGTFRQLSMGKGCTRSQARASALGEAIERYAAVWQGDEPRREAPAVELGDAAVHPAALQHFSAAQHAAAGPTGAGHGAQRLAAPYDPHTPLWWTPVWSLTHQRRRWLPTAWCYREVPRPVDRRHVIADSNGRAAGNCLEEAILQGFLELVERDAVAIWWYGRQRRPAFDLDALASPYVDALRAHFDGIEWDVWCLDVTHDLGLPVCVALARERATGAWCVGFGCHLEARLAVTRALTELCQLLDPSPRRRVPWAGLDDEAFLYPVGAARRPDDFDDLRVGDVSAAVELCVARAARAGLETLALDMSRPDIELAVAMVCVPGLRHFWPRFGPGRLYDVPVAMGWRPAPLCEGALNPTPLFL